MSTKDFDLNSNSETFQHFCGSMTRFAENHLDYHKPKYYKISRDAYS